MKVKNHKTLIRAFAGFAEKKKMLDYNSLEKVSFSMK